MSIADVSGVLSPIFPKDIVEGMLAENLGEIKKSLDMLFYNPMGMDENLNAQTTRSIALGFVQDALIKLAPYSDSALHPKHRQCRKALMEMSRRLEANPVNSKTRRFDEVKFGYDITDFITVFHKCLAECTPPKERSRVLRRFVDRRKV
tara:strand:- start:3793 stop:4239 length:447 start_codon:yes stop_codon:yes gene_type:complete